MMVMHHPIGHQINPVDGIGALVHEYLAESVGYPHPGRHLGPRPEFDAAAIQLAEKCLRIEFVPGPREDDLLRSL